MSSNTAPAVAGDTWVATPDGAVPAADLAPGLQPGASAAPDAKLVGLHGVPVRLAAVHHLGTCDVLAVVAGERELHCTPSLALLSRAVVEGAERLVWRAAGELVPGDPIALAEPAAVAAVRVPVLAGARAIPGAPEPGFFAWTSVELVAALGAEPVYALDVDAADHACVTDGFVAAPGTGTEGTPR